MIMALALLPADQIYTSFVLWKKLNFVFPFLFHFLRPFNVKMLLICNWSFYMRFTNIGQVIGWQLKPQLVAAFVARKPELTTTLNHGIVGFMRAVTDTDRISAILAVILHHITNYMFMMQNWVYILHISVHLQECEETAWLDFIVFIHTEHIRRVALSIRVAEKKRLIIQKERDLEDGLIDIYEFLHQSMSSFKPAEVNLIIILL